MNGPRDHARELLEKAENDLIAARATLATGKAFDTVCFHAQQATEKSIKAILALHDVGYPWRHDLAELLELVKPFAPDLEPLSDGIAAMTPYAVEARYYRSFRPGEDEARRTLATAGEVNALARKRVEAGEIPPPAGGDRSRR